ncbi:hypothetical protein LH506_04345 [Lapidilactobacillus dextrinicus]|uniref:hypothetical protein n=1 Tax=Lapidilactobacillus dextrinicus TaxID=51664 RepID=UPI00070A0634|nr:hypothetical protein [Lapidilactobacillus dextrinicus]QFG46721.1 hypothetical protein LH506_04345 [Lapidilactobacillus dextrinicus]
MRKGIIGRENQIRWIASVEHRSFDEVNFEMLPFDDDMVETRYQDLFYEYQSLIRQKMILA